MKQVARKVVLKSDGPFTRFDPTARPATSSTLPPPTTDNAQRHLKRLTSTILLTYTCCNPSFRYVSSANPRRVLTKPSQGVSNHNYDNVHSDLILYVNDVLGLQQKTKYLVLDLLGQGTFGQVVKCKKLDTGDVVAVKVVKNRPAYFNQGMFEVNILEVLNQQFDSDKYNIVELLDYFIDREHLCLVFELLSVNMFELIKQNQYRGLSTNLIRVFLKQILKTLRSIADCGIIHCDLKPENILLRNQTTPQIKLIDFGSACYEHQTVYTYIQSRFYRSPEVIIGHPYTAAIDMWSLGCMTAELFLGLPLFPGHNEYNQLVRMLEMLGELPESILALGKFSTKFYNKISTEGGCLFRLKTEEQYAKEQEVEVKPFKRYFPYTSLGDIISSYRYKKDLSPEALEKEKRVRIALTDFLGGLLRLDPADRWTAEQAFQHPFITGEPFTGPFVPPPPAPREPIRLIAGTHLHPSLQSKQTPAPAAAVHSANTRTQQPVAPVIHNEPEPSCVPTDTPLDTGSGSVLIQRHNRRNRRMRSISMEPKRTAKIAGRPAEPSRLPSHTAASRAAAAAQHNTTNSAKIPKQQDSGGAPKSNPHSKTAPTRQGNGPNAKPVTSNEGKRNRLTNAKQQQQQQQQQQQDKNTEKEPGPSSAQNTRQHRRSRSSELDEVSDQAPTGVSNNTNQAAQMSPYNLSPHSSPGSSGAQNAARNPRPSKKSPRSQRSLSLASPTQDKGLGTQRQIRAHRDQYSPRKSPRRGVPPKNLSPDFKEEVPSVEGNKRDTSPPLKFGNSPSSKQLPVPNTQGKGRQPIVPSKQRGLDKSSTWPGPGSLPPEALRGYSQSSDAIISAALSSIPSSSPSSFPFADPQNQRYMGPRNQYAHSTNKHPPHSYSTPHYQYSYPHTQPHSQSRDHHYQRQQPQQHQQQHQQHQQHQQPHQQNTPIEEDPTYSDETILFYDASPSTTVPATNTAAALTSPRGPRGRMNAPQNYQHGGSKPIAISQSHNWRSAEGSYYQQTTPPRGQWAGADSWNDWSAAPHTPKEQTSPSSSYGSSFPHGGHELYSSSHDDPSNLVFGVSPTTGPGFYGSTSFPSSAHPPPYSQHHSQKPQMSTSSSYDNMGSDLLSQYSPYPPTRGNPQHNPNTNPLTSPLNTGPTSRSTHTVNHNNKPPPGYRNHLVVSTTQQHHHNPDSAQNDDDSTDANSIDAHPGTNPSVIND
eukprot:TRINITY_DN2843_c0_g1_i1.p1 TRINITY_DN2843_c0_g1~~TRINITY_DN2843_c0_g1_i1.p1  ORF type:complete len:1205 (+),score=187.13 TRINITY_DN2843_c0_g1_i1:310-3924(+)